MLVSPLGLSTQPLAAGTHVSLIASSTFKPRNDMSVETAAGGVPAQG